MSSPLISVDKLRVTYGKSLTAVADVDLSILEGETLGLVGESGCGKSTLGRALLRLEPITSGEVRIGDKALSKMRGAELRKTRADLQMIFQDPLGSLNPHRSVRDIVADPLRHLRKRTKKEALAEASELLDRVGLSGLGDRRPHEFSGGQRQRIGIARAIAPNPRFIVADEPVSALDVSVQAQVINLLVQLKREQQLTVLFISHDLGVVRHVADRIAVMYLGTIVEIADRDAFFAGPLHPYSEALLSAVPELGAPGEEKRERIVLRGELPNPGNPPPGCRFSSRCMYAQERCVTETPELRMTANGRQVSCHFPLQIQTAAARQADGEQADAWKTKRYKEDVIR
ncbi:ABC transporter ATP-binding protein [Microbacterium sp.]|uniref:ABC transporter ATP-binding protein n=1 Tax=Microbacterium sp. TaxID=51671 RepID=UPI0037C83A87